MGADDEARRPYRLFYLELRASALDRLLRRGQHGREEVGEALGVVAEVVAGEEAVVLGLAGELA